MKIFLMEISSVNWSAETIENLKTFLSDSEKERVDKSQSFKAKTSFIAGRVLIKTALAKILNCRAEDVILKITKKGRPEIEFPASTLSFNLSHSNNLLALVISQQRVGIDVEFFKKRNFLEIAESFFTLDQQNLLKKTDAFFEQQKLFYKFWTRKEASIKCNGEQIFNHGLIDSNQLITLPIDENYLMSIAVKSEDQIPKTFEVQKLKNFQPEKTLFLVNK